MADGNWKVVRAFVAHRFGQHRCRSSCLHSRQRLGFVLTRPKKRLLKADQEKRDACVTLSAALRAEAQAPGATIFFVDDGLFRAEADRRGQWVRKGAPALVDSTSPALSEKVPYYSAVCLEAGAVATREVEGNGPAATAVRFLRQLRAPPAAPVIVVWDNGPAHRGAAVRACRRGQAALSHDPASPS